MEAAVFLGGVLSLLSPVHGFFGTLFPDYDVLFNVDTSGSIYELGTSPYAPLELMDFQKLYIRDLAIGMQSVNARMGFFLYAKDVNKSRNIQFWGNVDEVTTFVDGLTWTGGLGDACGAIEASLQEFESLSLAGVGRPQLLMLFADDQPRSSDGNCPETLCDYATAIRDQGITVMVIGLKDECAADEEPSTDCFCKECYECIADYILPAGDPDLYVSPYPSPAQAVANLESAHDAGYVRKKENSWLEVHGMTMVFIALAVAFVACVAVSAIACFVCKKDRASAEEVASDDKEQEENKDETEMVEVVGLTTN